MLRRISLLALLWPWLQIAAAQNEPIRFGKLDAQAFTPSQYKGADTAPAVVLCDYGTSRIEGASDGFQLVFDRVTRILILNKAGYDEATVQIPLYHHENREEQLQNLRAVTYNLVNGRIEKQRLDDKAVFKENLDARRTLRKFTMPGVREGSIIEYAYTIKSDFLFNFQDWQFQRDIPVEWSEYRTIIPGFFLYKEIPHGYLRYSAQGRDLVAYSTSYSQSSRDSYGNVYNQPANHLNITAQAVRSVWVMKQVPAFRPEPYMTSRNDYLAALDFELEKIQFDPKQAPVYTTATWEKINAELLKEENFGQLLTGRTPLTPAAEALATRHPDPAARAAAAVELVQQNVRYNDEERLYATAPLRRVVDQHRGNSAEMNLLLVHALRDAGLDAHPVLVSTRRHGRTQTEVPLLSQFNYVVASVSLPGQRELLLDATEPLLEPGTLPERCLNGQGRLVKPDGGRWVSLATTQRYMRMTTARLTLDAQGTLRGQWQEEYNGYAGLAERGRVVANGGEQAYLKSLNKTHPEWQFAHSKVQNLDKRNASLLVNAELTVPGAEAPVQQLFLPLMQLFTDAQNPFQPTERTFPVDFGMLHDFVTSVTVALPAGYSVEELPKPAVLELPNGAGRYTYEAKLLGNSLLINSRLQLQKVQYLPGEYPALRELFTRSVAKHAEPLVLRRAQ